MKKANCILLTETAENALRELAHANGLNKSSQVETLIREAVRKNKRVALTQGENK